jgi:rhodanese-related sulfurtransferase
MFATIGRIGPEQAMRNSRNGALLVCGYDSDEKFRKNHLEGAISLSELRSRESALTRDQELIFYCA